MAYYYVKSGLGTCTTDNSYGTKLTGAFGSGTLVAANVYASLADVITYATTIAADDFVLCSDVHSTTSAPTTWEFNGATVMSVDDTNADQYKAGATETDTGVMPARSNAYIGMTVGAALSIEVGAEQRTFFEDCTVKVGGTGRYLGAVGDGSWLHIRNSTVDLGTGSSTEFNSNKGGFVVLENVSLTGTAAANMGFLCTWGGGGGNTFRAYNCDFSNCGATYMFETCVATDDNGYAYLERCSMPDNFSMVAAINDNSFTYEIQSCTDGTNADAFYYFEYHDYYGEVSASTTVYKDATYDGSTGVSAVFDTSANCSLSNPLRYKIATIGGVDLTSSRTVTVEALCATALTAGELWIEVFQTDDTDNSMGKLKSSIATDRLTSTTMTDTNDNASWTGDAGTENTYSLSVTTDAVSGLDADSGLLEVYVCVGKATVDVWVDPAVTVT